MIVATDEAIEKIKEFAEAEGISALQIRVKVIGGGCAGFSYDISFSENYSDEDEIFTSKDVAIITDTISLQFLENAQIHWFETPIGSGFKIINPNVTSTCGCGSSVSF